MCSFHGPHAVYSVQSFKQIQTKMKIKKFFAALLLMVIGTAGMVAQEMQMPPIPVDEAVRIGKLDNGLTYYIRHNEWPEKSANFYIAQRVGSINEDDSQRGLAHFLEHMAFNGSEHFPGNGLIDFTRSLGVEFGSNLNAYTSIDQTVYRVCAVPTTKGQAALDSCLLILKDWSNGLLLEPDEIDKERDVVHNEWRLGESAQQRLITRSLKEMYPGSKYGERMPIGLMEIIDSFQPQTLRNYYEKWYRPDNQAIIVVGDIDVDYTEAKIKELFSGIVVPADAAQVVDVPVPDNEQAIYIFDKDKEQAINQIMVFMKHDTTTPEEKSSISYLIEMFAKGVIGQMLSQRLNEMTQNPDCPFFQAVAEDGQYMISKTKDAFQLIGVPKEGRDMETLQALIREAKRARDFGFTATEYERAKADYLAMLEKQYTNRNKIHNDQFGNDYRDNYLTNEPIPSIEMLYQIMNSIAPQLPVEMVNMALPELIGDSEKNLVVIEWAREADGLTYPTEADMKKAVESARAEKLEAYVDNVKDEPLIAPEKMPKAGKITGEKENAQFGYKELTLSNGAKVILKKTDYKENEIVMRGFSKGGESLYGPADYTNLKVFGNVIGISGLGNFSSNELTKALAGKNCNADLSMSKTRQYVTANSTPKDIETMMQMVYLYFTDVKKDESQMQNLMTQLDMALKNKYLSPDAVFSDTLSNTMYCHNPRFASLDVEDLKDINYDRILEIAKERYQNAGQFTFVFLGNFDEATLRPLIEQYIASLPATKAKPEDFKETRTLAMGQVKNHFRVKSDSPKATAVRIWNTYAPYTLENDIKLSAAGQILSQIYLKTIREDESAAYSVGAYGGFNLSGKDAIMQLQAYCPMNPDKQEIANRLLDEGFENCTKTIDADILNKVKEFMLKQADEDAKKNGHWMGVITTWLDYGFDSHSDYKKIVESLTPQTMADFFKQIKASGNCIDVVMLPEE